LTETLIDDLRRTRRYAWLARRAVLRIARLVQLPALSYRHVPGDPADDPIVQTALSAKAHFLVTADKELLKLTKVRSVEIITAKKTRRADSQPKLAAGCAAATCWAASGCGQGI
jgi:predicted nucleic acid-binding protein